MYLIYYLKREVIKKYANATKHPKPVNFSKNPKKGHLNEGHIK